MRCLNCNTLVAPRDPRCMSCGAQCTATVSEQDAARGSSTRVGLIVLAVLFLGIAGYQALESYHILSSYDRTYGRLVRIEKRVGRKSVSYIGTIDFVAKNGTTFQAQINARSMFVGASVPVLYDRNNPNNNRADDTNSLWGFPLAGGGIGFVCLLIGLLTPGGRAAPRAEERARPDAVRPSLASAFAKPISAGPWQTPPVVMQQDPSPRKRGRVVRAFFGAVWVVVFLFASVGVAAVVAGLVSTSAAVGDPELQKQMAEQAGATVGPWVVFGSISLAVLLACLGLLPGTRRTRR
jgi:hypothetical protein